MAGEVKDVAEGEGNVDDGRQRLRHIGNSGSHNLRPTLPASRPTRQCSVATIQENWCHLKKKKSFSFGEGNFIQEK